MFVKLDDDIDEEESDPELRPSYLYMEMKSTVAFKEIDIDSMLEHTSYDDFMRGLYSSHMSGLDSEQQKEMRKREAEQQTRGIQLDFDEGETQTQDQ